MSNTSYDLTEFESLMSLDNPINSSKATRWERKANQQQQLDRYIPNRSAMEKNDENFERAENTETSEHAKLILANQMESSKGSRVLAFKNKAPAPVEGYSNSLKVLYSTQSAKRGEVVKPTRHIASAPVRVLDAPSLLDDYCKLTHC
jgi:cell division cycle protein 20 (cofactor of APC complex)